MRLIPGSLGEVTLLAPDGNPIAVAATETLEETDVIYLTVAGALYAFRSTELRRLTARVPADAMVIPTTDGLLSIASPFLVAPDGAMDMARAVGDIAALGLGVAAVAPRTPGAGEVQASLARIVSSTTRVTLATPAAGNRIRVLGGFIDYVSTLIRAEVYFDTGATIDSDTAKAVAEAFMLNPEQIVFTFDFPDGGGPIGAVDDVLSVRGNQSIASNLTFLVLFREE